MTDIASLNGLKLDNIQLSTSTSSKGQLTFEYDTLLKNRISYRGIKATSVITDDTLALQLKEFFRNRHMGIIDFSTIIGENLDGLYLLRSGKVSEKYGNSYKLSFSLEGKFPRHRWSLGKEERDTHWELYDSCLDGDITQLSNYWISGAVDAGDYIELNSNGDKFSFGEIIRGDYIIEGSLQIEDAISTQLKIWFRVAEYDSLPDMGYYFLLEPNNDRIGLWYYDGSATGVVTWYNMPIETGTWINFKLEVVGEKFTLYLSGDIDEEPKHIISIRHHLYKAGVIGFEEAGSDADIWIDNLYVYQIKPSLTVSPEGAFMFNDAAIGQSNRLQDNEGATESGGPRGDFRTFVNPKSPLTFVIDNDDVAGFNDPTSYNVKVFDTMNEILEADWVEVFHPDHDFTGEIVIQNNIIRLQVKDQDEFIVSLFVDSAWEDITFLTQWSSISIESVERIISYLSPHKVTMREITKYDSGGGGYDLVWSDYTIMRGHHLIQTTNERGI